LTPSIPVQNSSGIGGCGFGLLLTGYVEIPYVRQVNNAVVQRNYLQIKQDVQEKIPLEIERLLSDPALSRLVIKKS
jgi:hypothetical protein